MPCYEPPRECSCCKKINCTCLQDRIDYLTDLLCKHTKAFEPIHDDVKEWFEQHKIVDLERLGREREVK